MALLALGVQAADTQRGRQKAAAACNTCHGASGVSTAPDAPHLAAQPEPYLVEQLRRFRDGRRKHEVMSVIAKPLTDAEIEDLSAWYSSIAITATPPK